MRNDGATQINGVGITQIDGEGAVATHIEGAVGRIARDAQTQHSVCYQHATPLRLCRIVAEIACHRVHHESLAVRPQELLEIHGIHLYVTFLRRNQYALHVLPHRDKRFDN